MIDRKHIDYYNAVELPPEFDFGRHGRDELPQEADLVRSWVEWLAACRQIGMVVEIGCGKGALRNVHERYVGVDLSVVTLRGVDARRVATNAEDLPFRNGSVSVIFSIAALEHVPRPELAMEEIARVLEPGGIAVLAPAWFCRDWAAKALPIRSYDELRLRDKIAKALIPLRNNFLWRAAWTLPARLWRELKFAVRGRIAFTYRRLEPNLDEYIYSDCDAFTSMDPQTAVLYFKGRGLRVLEQDGFRRRLLLRNVPIVIQAPEA